MIKFQITSEFASDDKLKEAQKLLHSQSIPSSNLLVSWNHIAKKIMQTAKLKPRAPKGEISTVVELDDRVVDSPGVAVLESLDMLKRTNKKPSTLPPERFETFFSVYPFRITESGAKTKGSKREALKAFSIEIQTEEDFQNLMSAVENYKKICSTKPKDAVRFVRGGFYKEYVGTDLVKPRQETTSKEELEEMLA
jgi:hypothetical protein